MAPEFQPSTYNLLQFHVEKGITDTGTTTIADTYKIMCDVAEMVPDYTNHLPMLFVDELYDGLQQKPLDAYSETDLLLVGVGLQVLWDMKDTTNQTKPIIKDKEISTGEVFSDAQIQHADIDSTENLIASKIGSIIDEVGLENLVLQHLAAIILKKSYSHETQNELREVIPEQYKQKIRDLVTELHGKED